MKHNSIIFPILLVFVVFSTQLRGQFIKNEGHAIHYLKYKAKDTFLISNQYYTFDLTRENEYLICKVIKYKINYAKMNIVNEGTTLNYLINLNDSLSLIKAKEKNQINSIIYKNHGFSFVRPIRRYSSNNERKRDIENSNSNAERFHEAFNVLKSNFNQKETESFKLTELKKWKTNNAKPEISEEQRKYIVQANAANEKKDYENALLLFHNAIEINPYAYPAAYYNMALIHSNLDNYYQAIYAMKQYLIVDPEAEDARKAQDKIYEWELNIKK